MKREIRFSEKLLLSGFCFILLFMFMQDWVPLGSLNDVQAIAEERPFNELIIVTMINVVQILLLIGFVIIFMGKRYPVWIKLWLIIHQVCIFAGALLDGGFLTSLGTVLIKESKDIIKCLEIHTPSFQK